MYQDFKLPKGWARPTLDKVAKIKSGGTPSTSNKEYWGGDIPWIGSEKVKDNIIKECSKYITKKGLENSSTRKFPKHTVLVALTGATTAKVGYLDFECTGNQSITGIYPSKFFNSKFIFYALIRERTQILKRKIGSAQYHINQRILESTMIPFSPLKEQNQIVFKIEEYIEKISFTKQKLKNINLQLELSKLSLLRDAYEGKLTEKWRKENPQVESGNEILDSIIHDENKKINSSQNGSKKSKSITFDTLDCNISGWINVRLENLIYISGRIGWKGLKAEEYTESGPAFLSVYNLIDGNEVDFNNINHISNQRFEESPEIQIKENDILLTKDGSGIGKIGMVKNLPGPSTINSSLLIIRSEKAFIPKFLFYFFKGPKLQKIVRERITGSQTPHLFQKDIKKFILPLTSFEEQEQIVSKIEFSINSIEKTKQIIDNNLEKLETAKLSVLKSAFEGKLVPQDPNDEPAEKLLERIKKEK